MERSFATINSSFVCAVSGFTKNLVQTLNLNRTTEIEMKKHQCITLQQPQFSITIAFTVVLSKSKISRL